MTPHEELVERIDAAFSSRERPRDEEIAWTREAPADYEGNRVAAYFRERSPDQIYYASLVEAFGPNPGECFAFLRAEGIVYFLPAFLRVALDVEGSGDFPERLSFAISKPAPDAIVELKARFSKIVELLGGGQKAAVREALEAMAQEAARLGDPDCDALAALESYWRSVPARGDDGA